MLRLRLWLISTEWGYEVYFETYPSRVKLFVIDLWRFLEGLGFLGKELSLSYPVHRI
jgi:hypothetical protein